MLIQSMDMLNYLTRPQMLVRKRVDSEAAIQLKMSHMLRFPLHQTLSLSEPQIALLAVVL